MINYNWKNKKERAAAAVAHTQKMARDYSEFIKHSVKHTEVYGPIYSLPLESEAISPHGVVCSMDSVTAAFHFRKGKTAILNFASHKNPGGMFIEGSQAQEECLCHESCLYNVLKEKQEYYDWNKKNLNRALYVNRGLYSPSIIFQHGKEVFDFDVITCAAPNKKAAQKYQNVSDAENSKVLKSRIKFVLDIAKDQGVNTLILGAYGCGVFGQDATEVAQIFKNLLPFYRFDRVIFAIPQGLNDNFGKFVNVLWKEKKQ